MEVRDNIHKVHTQHLTCVVHTLLIVCLFVCSLLPSIGGDNTLETVTTLPSKSNALVKCSTHKGTRWQTRSVTRLVFYHLFYFTSDILKKFNSEIKGVSKGEGKTQTGFNMAVSGAKGA